MLLNDEFSVIAKNIHRAEGQFQIGAAENGAEVTGADRVLKDSPVMAAAKRIEADQQEEGVVLSEERDDITGGRLRAQSVIAFEVFLVRFIIRAVLLFRPEELIIDVICGTWGGVRTEVEVRGMDRVDKIGQFIIDIGDTDINIGEVLSRELNELTVRWSSGSRLSSIRNENRLIIGGIFRTAAGAEAQSGSQKSA